jgi:hypothetical protein
MLTNSKYEEKYMKSIKTKLLVGLSFIGILAVYFVSSGNSSLSFPGSIANAETKSLDKIIGVKKTDQGDVVVNLEPRKYKDGKLTVRLQLETHNVNNLGTYNYKEIIKLESGNQKISPSSVPRIGGHHNTGDLVFNIDNLSDQFKIKVSGLNRPGVREFSWP